ncbi:hypothetical protein [Reichenbachiella sp.]|uniref:hypothetical protein n=1 Tax=Reichenbachiella sp. TaxID=2184521 RepID=UPI003BAF3CDC
MRLIKILLIILATIFSQSIYAQEAERGEFKNHKLSLIIGHAYVPAGVNILREKVWTVLPSWGLDYDFRFNEKWGLGIHTDLVVESFEYEGNEKIVFERTRPFSAVLVGSRKFGKHLTLMAGGGIEYAKEENLKLVRIGFDYGWELPNEWELSASLMSDFKIDAYNSWVIGLGVGKLF